MANHPINLGLRFLLELFNLYALGRWGWTQNTGIARYILTVGLPLVAAALWGIFRVPGDPKSPPVAIPGWLRLLLEAGFFGAGSWAMYASNAAPLGLVFAVLVILHYLASYDRVLWLIRNRFSQNS